MEITSIIAANLKILRSQRNLSLGQLSTLCDVSKVMLSQIEKGETNPTINILWKIANGLKVPYTALLEQQVVESDIIRKSHMVQTDGGNGNYRAYCYYPCTPHRNFELFQIELDAGHTYVSGGHSEKSWEYVMVLQGSLRLTTAGQEYILCADDAIEFSASSEHTYEALGSATMHAVVINYYGT